MPHKKPKQKSGLRKYPNKETMEFMLQGRGGRHRSKTTYSRKEKHRGNGYGE